ncbi:MAG TPA: flippase-like domain-containing protein, partial [Tepidisphaeraceae bacterium]|nr:flippase-like domain-containing protein [Tepidisphaeraceae bacterium]
TGVAAGVGFVHPRGNGRLANRVRALTGPWRRMRTDWRGLGTICLVYAVVVLLRASRLQLSFWALGSDVSFAAALVASALADLAFILSFTPSGLGFREGAIVVTAGLLGVSRDACLAAALLDRIIWTAAVIVVAQYGFYRLIRPAGLPATPGADAASTGSRPDHAAG